MERIEAVDEVGPGPFDRVGRRVRTRLSSQKSIKLTANRVHSDIITYNPNPESSAPLAPESCTFTRKEARQISLTVQELS